MTGSHSLKTHLGKLSSSFFTFTETAVQVPKFSICSRHLSWQICSVTLQVASSLQPSLLGYTPDNKQVSFHARISLDTHSTENKNVGSNRIFRFCVGVCPLRLLTGVKICDIRLVTSVSFSWEFGVLVGIHVVVFYLQLVSATPLVVLLQNLVVGVQFWSTYTDSLRCNG